MSDFPVLSSPERAHLCGPYLWQVMSGQFERLSPRIEGVLLHLIAESDEVGEDHVLRSARSVHGNSASPADNRELIYRRIIQPDGPDAFDLDLHRFFGVSLLWPVGEALTAPEELLRAKQHDRLSRGCCPLHGFRLREQFEFEFPRPDGLAVLECISADRCRFEALVRPREGRWPSLGCEWTQGNRLEVVETVHPRFSMTPLGGLRLVKGGVR